MCSTLFSIHSNLDCFVCPCCIGRRQTKLCPSRTKFNPSSSSWAHYSCSPHNSCSSCNQNRSTCTTCDQIRYIEQCERMEHKNRSNRMANNCVFFICRRACGISNIECTSRCIGLLAQCYPWSCCRCHPTYSTRAQNHHFTSCSNFSRTNNFRSSSSPSWSTTSSCSSSTIIGTLTTCLLTRFTCLWWRSPLVNTHKHKHTHSLTQYYIISTHQRYKLF